MVRTYFATLALLIAFPSTGVVQPKKLHGQTLQRAEETSIRGHWVMMDVNRISTPIRNNGSFNRDPNSANAGFEWPQGSGKTANYASGLWLGGKVAGEVRVAAAEYAYEFDAGPIVNGRPANPHDPLWRVFSIKRGDNAATSIDYAEWPWQHGAPSIIAPDGSRIPEMIGDQTVWCVFNDADSSRHTAFDSPPLCVEVQLTAYAYANGNQLGDNIFYKWRIINKSGMTIDSMYVSIWSDVDLGYAGDDMAGCDTTLGLGYVYNDGVDGIYGSMTPATGFALLQGPIVPGSPVDTARFPDGQVVPGMKLLKMTSFVAYNNNPVFGNPYTARDAWYYQQGLDRNGLPLRDNNGNITKFMFPGDPNLPPGPGNWIEVPGTGRDRFLLSAGPFTFAEGDTQEIAAANLISVGNSPIQSVTALKDAAALLAGVYASNYHPPDPSTEPIVSAQTFDKEIYLNWNDGDRASQRVLEIESTRVFDPLAQASGAEPYYDFEGYVVYQYDDALGTNPRIVATFDRADNPDGGPSPGLIVENLFDPNLGQVVPVVVKYGTNLGVSRSIRITADLVAGGTLVNARDYYFGVTSYLYNAGSVPKTLESPATILTVRPAPPLGIQPRSAKGDTITVTRIAGASDGLVQAAVTEPHRVTGDMYSITFSYDPAAERIVWNVDDLTTGQRKISGQVNQSGDDAYPTFDGIQVKVIGPPTGMKGAIEVSNASGPHIPTQACFLFNGSDFPTIIPCEPIAAPCDRPAPQVGGDAWGIHTSAAGILGDFHYPMFVSRVFRFTNLSRFAPYDFEIRFTPAGGLGYMRFSTQNVVQIPFELWNVGINTPDDPSDDYRMVPGIFDTDSNDMFNLVRQDHPISGGDNDPETDWIYWYNPVDMSPGQGGYAAWAVDPDPENLLGGEVMAHMVLVNFNGGTVSDSTFPANVDQLLPETGTVIRIISTKPHQPNSDVYTLSTAGREPLRSVDLARADINLINVVPNPYFGASAYEKQLDPVLRFTNLPVGAKVRIFTLAGALVRTIENSGPGTSADWDLHNEKERMVASGMYIAHVDIPGIGSKILKIAVVL